jgi:hypothetical protein
LILFLLHESIGLGTSLLLVCIKGLLCELICGWCGHWLALLCQSAVGSILVS